MQAECELYLTCWRCFLILGTTCVLFLFASIQDNSDKMYEPRGIVLLFYNFFPFELGFDS